jgi:hypothetical protein
MLRDPADRAIVASARVHNLRLVTSDRRIIESKLAPVVECASRGRYAGLGTKTDRLRPAGFGIVYIGLFS